MLVIRAEQMRILERAVRRPFEDEMCRHLRLYFGEFVAHLPETVLRERVAETITRALDYGLIERWDCELFLNLAAALGWHFDQTQQYRWVGECLRNPHLGDISTRISNITDTITRGLTGDEEASDE